MTVVLQGQVDDPYRGPDRRRRNDGLLAPAPLSKVLLVSLLVTVGAWLPALFFVPRHPSAGDLGAYAAIVGGLLYVCAGGARLIVWKVGGRALCGWLGPAFVVLGVMIGVSDGLSTFGVAPVSAVRPADGLIAAATVGWLMWRGLTGPEVNAGLRPLAALACAAVGGLAAMGVLDAAQAAGVLPAWMSGRAADVGFDTVSALVWLAVSAATKRAVRQGRPGVSPWAANITGLLAVASVVRAVSPLPWASTLASAACIFSAAAITLGSGMSRMRELLALKDQKQRSLQLALTATIRQAAGERRALEAWLHDLRNAVAGLQAADAVLRDGVRTGARSEPELAGAMTAELARLHAMIEPARQLQTTEVDLAATLSPIVAAERARGVAVELRLDARTVVADAGALGRVVQNLLTNARLYAPGSPVAVASVPRGQMVEVSVTDGGPGIDPAERSSVFEDGRRGTASTGTDGNGLGLFVVRTLVVAMHGTVEVSSDRGAGCRMVVLLPAPAPVPRPVAADAPLAPAPWPRIGATA